MELRYFLSVLSKRKWLILFVMLASAATTYMIVKKLPKKYMASAALSTGITDLEKVRVDDPNPFVQEFEIENKFGNLIEYMKARPALNALTKKLMLNDLRPKDNAEVYRKFDPSKVNVSKEQIENYLDRLESSPDSTGISDSDLENMATARTLEKALGYDYETLRNKIEIKRNGKTDYVLINYTSENPKLSFFIVDTYVKEFLSFNRSKRETVENKSLTFYRSLTDEKKRVLDSLNEVFAHYTARHQVVALEQQGQSIVQQIKDAEMTRDNERRRLKEAESVLSVAQKEHDQVKTLYGDGYDKALAVNNQLIAVSNELKDLKLKYAMGNEKDAKLKKRIDELENIRKNASRSNAVNRRSENDVLLRNDDEIYKKYLNSKSDVDGSRAALAAIEKNLSELRGKRDKLVGNNADMTLLTQQIKIAEKEYEYAVERQNQADVIKESSEKEQPMKVIEPPIPPVQPIGNKAALLSAFSGMSMGTLATFTLFILTFFDRSLATPFQFGKQVGLNLLGTINRLKSRKYINIDNLFTANDDDKEANFFKESLRKIRHDVEVSGAQSFLFTSLREQEGKSFLAASLAYNLAMKNKKVLIIDTNFKNNTLTHLSAKQLVNNFVTEGNESSVAATRLDLDISLPTVDILGNKGGKNSPSELLSGVDFGKTVRELGKKYDFIFLEASCLTKYSDARELVDYVDKVIAVFDSNTVVSATDENSLAFLKGLNEKLLGCILNKVELKNLN